jgi:hypothetical protein
MKKLVLLTVLAIAFISCDKEDINEIQEPTAEARVVGTWQMYKDENLESIIDEWTGTDWTYVDQWFQNTREDSDIILEFRADGTFVDRYADVETANGVWGVLDDGRYYFDYIQDGENTNEFLIQRRYITIYCDNTYALNIDGNDRRVEYYKIIDTVECSDLITYNVQ